MSKSSAAKSTGRSLGDHVCIRDHIDNQNLIASPWAAATATGRPLTGLQPGPGRPPVYIFTVTKKYLWSKNPTLAKVVFYWLNSPIALFVITNSPNTLARLPRSRAAARGASSGLEKSVAADLSAVASAVPCRARRQSREVQPPASRPRGRR